MLYHLLRYYTTSLDILNNKPFIVIIKPHSKVEYNKNKHHCLGQFDYDLSISSKGQNLCTQRDK